LMSGPDGQLRIRAWVRRIWPRRTRARS
jgi:hypothetical protein